MFTCAVRWPRLGLLLALAACGGSGDPGATGEVVRVSSAQVAEGDAGTSVLAFTLSAGLPILQPIVVRYATASTAGPGGTATGSAQGGAACAPGVNYVDARGEVTLNPGEAARVAVTVCANTVFEPDNTLALDWSVGGQSGRALGTIVNDDPAGLGDATLRVDSAQVLEGNEGTSTLSFAVSTEPPLAHPIVVKYTTASTAKPGGGGTGSAKGGAACAAGVNYLDRTGEVTLNPGATASVAIIVCANTVFEPNNTLALDWSVLGLSGRALGTIVNDDPGGLNGTGAAEGFGRDSNPLTNSDADGRLGFSFTKLPSEENWLCTRDNVTGLVWLRQETPPFRLTFWADLPAYETAMQVLRGARANRTCGFEDWRLPGMGELASLIDAGRTEPAIDARWFPQQGASSSYWTDEYVPGLSPNFWSYFAWVVDFLAGEIQYGAARESRLPARLVAGRPSPSAQFPACIGAPRFTDHLDGTVTDHRTGLMWKKCMEGYSGADCGDPGASPIKDFEEGLRRAGVVNADPDGLGVGYADWRLPTRNELLSLVDLEGCSLPPFDLRALVFMGEQRILMTSTPIASRPEDRWGVSFRDGRFVKGLMAEPWPGWERRVRLVRAGQ